jgi:surface protein
MLMKLALFAWIRGVFALQSPKAFAVVAGLGTAGARKLMLKDAELEALGDRADDLAARLQHGCALNFPVNPECTEVLEPQSCEENFRVKPRMMYPLHPMYDDPMYDPMYEDPEVTYGRDALIQLKAAVDLWFEDECAAKAVYGRIEDWDVSCFPDMSGIFSGRSLSKIDLSRWDTSAVTDMSSMFARATNIGDILLSSLDTSAVTDMSSMFDGATNIGDISSLDTSSVTKMYAMFYYSPEFNQDLCAWDTSSVTDMSLMFDGANSFNQDLCAWDTSAVTIFMQMFPSNPRKPSAFDQDLSCWSRPPGGYVIWHHFSTGTACKETNCGFSLTEGADYESGSDARSEARTSCNAEPGGTSDYDSGSDSHYEAHLEDDSNRYYEPESQENTPRNEESSVAVIVPCVIGAVLLVAAGLVLWRKRRVAALQPHRQSSMPTLGGTEAEPEA